MDWYYAEDSARKGPVSELDFNELVRTGRIQPETKVWREGWTDWRPFSAAGGVGTTADGVTSAPCVECSRVFPTTEMVQYQDAFVCPDCKPVFFQKVKEGVELRREMNYAGFWIRFAAKFIDGVIVGIPGYAIQFGTMALFPDPEMAMTVMLIGWVISFALNIAYSTWMHGKFGATVGKMACGLRLVTPSGGKISYGLAAGRFFAEIVSSMIIYIGYIMVAFDEEKRALHDRICNTRVIRSRA